MAVGRSLFRGASLEKGRQKSLPRWFCLFSRDYGRSNRSSATSGRTRRGQAAPLTGEAVFFVPVRCAALEIAALPGLPHSLMQGHVLSEGRATGQNVGAELRSILAPRGSDVEALLVAVTSEDLARCIEFSGPQSQLPSSLSAVLAKGLACRLHDHVRMRAGAVLRMNRVDVSKSSRAYRFLEGGVDRLS